MENICCIILSIICLVCGLDINPDIIEDGSDIPKRGFVDVVEDVGVVVDPLCCVEELLLLPQGLGNGLALGSDVVEEVELELELEEEAEVVELLNKLAKGLFV